MYTVSQDLSQMNYLYIYFVYALKYLQLFIFYDLFRT